MAPLLCLVAGCNSFSRQRALAEYTPSEGILEIAAVLRRHVPDDTYRFPPAIDYSGRNVYRSALLRLENLERTEADALRSGYMDGVLPFAKARALERLRAFDLAAEQYRVAGTRAGDLQPLSLASAATVARIAEAVAIGLDLRDPLGRDGDAPLPLDAESILIDLDERIARLNSILDDVSEPPETSENEPLAAAQRHYRFVVQEEIERADVIRALYFVDTRAVRADGTLLALQELQRVATRHGASKNRLRHLLRLADFYADLARHYLAAVPPETIDFDPARFDEMADAAIQLYQLVATHDGRPEKLEAARSLEAFLALTLTIDADRFSS